MLRGRSRLFLTVITLVATLYVLFCISREQQIEVDKRALPLQTVQTEESKQIVILYWTTIFNGKPVLDSCPGNCKFVANRSMLSEADAVIFHGDDVRLADLASRTSENQRFVFWSMETTFGYGDKLRFVGDHPLPRSYFNWTMTISSKSDVHHPYGGYWIPPDVARKQMIAPEELHFSEADIQWEKKQKAIYWLSSNCHTPSKRELAVKRLSKFIPVEIAGKCGVQGVKCEGDCDRTIPEFYFYIAIENAVCDDYITEKYWNRYNLLSIPIVMRRRVYENRIPNSSFIAMDDFASPSALGEHLNYLMTNRTAYLDYFQWRNDGWARGFNIKGYMLGPCALCEKLHTEKLEKKTYSDVNSWYLDALKCEADEFAIDWK